MQQNAQSRRIQTQYLIQQQPPRAAPIFSVQPQESLVFNGITQCFQELVAIAKQANMALGITDAHGTLLRTWNSRLMQSAAEQAHFVEGGHWSTQAVGSNAIGLALNSRHAQCVHSHENEMHSVRDWVCYAAPILDPISGHVHGIINLSTKSHQHNVFGLYAVNHCARLIHTALSSQQQLSLQTFTHPAVYLNQKRLALNFRQIEILAILALHPQGLKLDQLHYALYGERDVTLNTLKAELSILRRHLPNCIENRIYRLSCPITCDFLQAENALKQGLIASTLNLYRGTFLNKTESPCLIHWRHCFDAKLSQLIYQMQDIDALLDLVSRVPECQDALQRLLDLLPQTHPAYQRLSILATL